MNTTTTTAMTQEVLNNATILVPDLNEGTKVALVSTDVLEYLIGLLPSAPLYSIKDKFINKIRATDDIASYVGAIQKELDFQLSVNMITEYLIEASKVPALPVESIDLRKEPRFDLNKGSDDAILDSRGRDMNV